MTAPSVEGDLSLLDIMLEDLPSAPELYRPTNFWSTSLPRIVSDLRSLGMHDFRRQPSARSFYAPTYAKAGETAPPPPSGRRAMLDRVMGRRQESPAEQAARRDYEIVRAHDPLTGGLQLGNATESSYGQPAEQFTFGNSRYSRSFLNYLRGLVFFKNSVPDAQVSTVLEIGGGFGSLGEILLQGNEVTYVDVDIPPVGFVATRYLQHVFGRDRIADYAETRHAERIEVGELTAARRSAVLMSWQLPRLVGPVDLFVNFISFQEMEPDVVRNYARHVAELDTRYVLMRNSAKGKWATSKPGVLGVMEPVVRATYLEAFSDYELVALDHETYGYEEKNFVSELMVLKRRS